MSANEKDLEIEDDLAKGQIAYGTLGNKLLISPCSSEDTPRPKVEDFLAIEEEFRFREGCQISWLANSIADSESNGIGRGAWRTASVDPLWLIIAQQNEVASHLEDAADLQEGFFPNDEKTQKYGNLLFLLQSEPRHIAHLCRLVTMAEIDSLLQTVMFTIYGNQYESREEHLLLTMFQVWLPIMKCNLKADWIP
jgi:Ras GTPase-activating-like protein IQGAP2/3